MEGKNRKHVFGLCSISSLDEGYEGLREAVWQSQVVKVERKSHVESFKI